MRVSITSVQLSLRVYAQNRNDASVRNVAFGLSFRKRAGAQTELFMPELWQLSENAF